MASVAAEFDEKPFNLLVYLGNLTVSWTRCDKHLNHFISEAQSKGTQRKQSKKREVCDIEGSQYLVILIWDALQYLFCSFFDGLCKKRVTSLATKIDGIRQRSMETL